VLLDFKNPFDLIPYYRRSYEKEILAKRQSKNFNLSGEKRQSIIWSHLLNAVRTYFENEMTKI
jgi:hypothetical protein